jgi:hypothetical protein
MFTQGKPSISVALMLGVPVLVLAIVLTIKHTGGKS